MLRVMRQFSVRAEMVDALHTLCWSFSLHRVIKSPPQLLNKTAVIIKLIVDVAEQGQAGKEYEFQQQRTVSWVSVAESSFNGRYP